MNFKTFITESTLSQDTITQVLNLKPNSIDELSGKTLRDIVDDAQLLAIWKAWRELVTVLVQISNHFGNNWISLEQYDNYYEKFRILTPDQKKELLKAGQDYLKSVQKAIEVEKEKVLPIANQIKELFKV